VPTLAAKAVFSWPSLQNIRPRPLGLGLRLLVPPKTFAPTGVSRIRFASIGYHSQRFAYYFDSSRSIS